MLGDCVVGVNFLSCGVGFSEMRTFADGEGGIDGAGDGERCGSRGWRGRGLNERGFMEVGIFEAVEGLGVEA